MGLFFPPTRYIHGHDAGAVEDDAAATGDDAFAGLSGVGVLFERGILHFLHDFKLPRALAFFLRDGLIGVRRHGGVVAERRREGKGVRR